MRDPDLVVRAQRAATALESAWCRWRNVHGLATDPPPAVSSYVGYSLDAPWGEGRIVFGVCAEEAEQLAEFLDRHDCVGPIHASVTAMPADGPASAPPEAAVGQPVAAGLLNVPAPSPASAGQQPLPAGAVGSRHRDSLASRPRGAARDPDAPSPLTAPVAPETRDTETPIAQAVFRALEAAQAAQTTHRTPPSDISPAPAPLAGPVAPAWPGSWAPPSAQPGGSGGPLSRGRTEELGAPRDLGEPGEDGTESAWVPWPERPGDTPAVRPEPAVPEASVPEASVPESAVPEASVPEVTAFRFRRPAAMTERARAVATPRADPAGEDTVQTPAPVRPLHLDAGRRDDDRDHDRDGDHDRDLDRDRDRDRIASAARHADAATWGASEVPGQAAVTDSAV
jgi:hypothetical protein